MKHAFREPGDEMPEGVSKLAHIQGVVAKVSWKPVDNPYTGWFGTGSENILMRFSETGMLHEDSPGLKPSVAFKFLRDKRHSDNIVAMPSFEGSGQWNFFDKPMRSKVKEFKKGSIEDLTLRPKLLEGSAWAFSTGLSVLTLHTENDTLHMGERKFPYDISFDPTDAVKNLFSSEKEIGPDGKQVSWLDQMKRIPAGTEIFKVTYKS